MAQVARNATMQDTGYLNGCRYLLHDRDQKFCPGISGHAGERGHEVPAVTTQKSEFECPRGTLGPYHQRGVSIQADLVWGALATACRVPFPGALSSCLPPGRPTETSSICFPSVTGSAAFGDSGCT